MIEPLTPQPGSPIDPGNAVGRHGVTARARRELRGANNLCVNDPRRMGKTVWLNVFCAAPGDGLEALHVDFEGVCTTEAFLLRMIGGLRKHQGLPSKALAKFRALFDNIDVAAGPISVKVGVASRAATELLDETLRSVDDHLPADTLLVIAMDEVPIAISNIAETENPAAAHRLLQTLRGLRHTNSQLRWIVCGSVGFHHVLRRCGATEGVINDLVNLPLGPLQDAEARELALRLLLGIERSGDDHAVAALVRHSGAIPFLIHVLAHRLQEVGTGPVSEDDVAAAFTDFMDDRDDSRTVTHLLTRLDPLYGDQAPAAMAVLDQVAQAASARTTDVNADDRLIDLLIDDHYLIEREGLLSWRYDVLRRIWMHRRRLR